jgi:membrane dipeptidase
MLLNRRDFLKGAALASSTLTAPMIARGRFRLFARSQAEYSRRAVDLVTESLVIDMLGLLTLDWGKLEHWERDPNGFRPADFHKLRSSGISVFHPAVDLNASGPQDAFEATSEWMHNWNKFLDSYPRELLRVLATTDLTGAKKDGKIGVVLGFQNSSHFRTIADVTTFYNLGQRVSQITYNEQNQMGCGCMAPVDTGLTKLGVAAVGEMNRLGMAVDVSHSGDRTTLETIEVSKRPVLITHANCRALNPRHPRCKTDDAIVKMAAGGGVIGITSVRGFVKPHDPTTIEDVIDHFEHVVKIAGVEHVGVGSDTDLDGRDHRPGITYRMDIDGLAHPKRIFDLTEGLIRRGYSDDNIRLMLGGNFHRALKTIWAA